ELRFNIPDLLQNRLVLRASSGARDLQVVMGTGAQHVWADGRTTLLEADLGRVKNVFVRWRQERSPPQATAMQVNELHLWDLKAANERLLSLLQYTVSQGAVPNLAIALPEALEVRRVETSRLLGGGPAQRLKAWRLVGTGNQRQLHLEFAFPVTTGVQVMLELVPSQPLGPSVLLPLPTPPN